MQKNLRNIFLIIPLVIIIFTGKIQAQLPAGSIAPDWTFTDMNGQSHTLYNYLDSGFVVIMDVSATWCNPCWQYHNTGALENFYNQYGPSGTKEAMVFWVEGDAATCDTLMYGYGGTAGFDCNSNGTITSVEKSQGNWLAGTPFPMFNPPSSQTNTFNNNYAIGYFPTVYRICPNRILKEITQPTASEAYAECQTCPPPASQANDPSILEYKGTTVSCGSVDIKVLIQNNGTSPLTACTITAMDGSTPLGQVNWTGNLAKYATALVTIGSATITGTTNMTISITSADANTVNNSILQTVIFKDLLAFPVSEGFENSSNFPIGWDVSNPDNDLTFLVDNSVGGFGASYSSAFLELYSSPAGNVDAINTTLFSFPSTTSPIKLLFTVAYAQYQSENDKLEVRVSTNCGTTWATKYAKAGTSLKTAPPTTSPFTPTASQWRTDSVDLSSFAGQTVMLQFKVTSAYGNNLYLDNINLICQAPSVILSASSTVACPGESITISTNNISGATWSWSDGQTSQNIVVSNPGTYTVTVTTSSGTTTNSITISAPPSPSASITASGATTFCSGGQVLLSASGAGAGGSYLWAPGGETTSSILASQTGSYYVTSINSCGDSINSSSLNINSLPFPAIPTISITTNQQSGTVIFTSSSPTGNQWFLNGNPVAGQTNQTYEELWQTVEGSTIAVSVTDNGCSSKSTPFIWTGQKELNRNSAFTIFPNPSSGLFNIAFNSTEHENIEIVVYNMLGMEVYKKYFSVKNTLVIDLGNLNNGVYHLSVNNASNPITVQKLLINK